jgi:hypothetical protein
MFQQLLSWGSVDVLALLAEVTQAREAAAAVEATRIVVVPAEEAFTQDAAVGQDNAALHAKNAEDRAALAESEELVRVSRVEAENAAALSSTHEDAEGFVRKIALLESELAVEHRAREVSVRR